MSSANAPAMPFDAASADARPASLPRRPLLRRVVGAFVAPDAFDFWASRLHPAWSWDRPLARIVARRAESADTVTLVLQPNRHWAGARPGQHVNVSAQIDGTRITRSYSPSAAPGADGRIAITVKAIPGGKLSQHLCHRARVGEVLDIGAAFGAMTLPEAGTAHDAGTEPYLFLAGGSGITPLMAMLRAQAASGMPVPITLGYWARRRDEHCFAAELRALADRHDHLRVELFATREDAGTGAAARIDAAALARLAPDLERRHVFACGPDGFVATARALAAGRALAFDAEAFTPPPRDAVPADAAGSVQVTLARSGRTLEVPRGQSLLRAFEAAGLKPASGCRMGLCNTCACGKRAGTTRHLHTGAVEHEPVTALRLCVSGAVDDLVLDL